MTQSSITKRDVGLRLLPDSGQAGLPVSHTMQILAFAIPCLPAAPLPSGLCFGVHTDQSQCQHGYLTTSCTRTDYSVGNFSL